MPVVTSFTYRPLLQEVPSTDHVVRFAPTEMVRVTVAMDNGVAYVVDTRKEHFRRLPSTTQVS